MLSIYQAGFHSLLLPESPALQKVIESGQKGSKVNKFLVCFGVFSGKSETKNGKSEIYFGFGAFVVLLSSSFVVAVVVSTECRWWCPPSAGGRLLWLVLLSCRVPRLLPAFLLSFTALPFKYALFRVLRAFLAGFGVQVYICMG